MHMKKSELNTLRSFVGHCERVFSKSPPPSCGTDTRTYNAYRLARYKELAKVKSIIDKLNDDVGTKNNASAG